MYSYIGMILMGVRARKRDPSDYNRGVI